MTDNRDTPTVFVPDERGVSEVLGAILVFGLLILLLTLLQTQAVPNANEEVEFEHNQMVRQDLSKFQEAIVRSAATGEEESVTLRVGTSYPPRMVFFNPSPPSGSLRTTAATGVELSNIVALNDETADYVDGSVGGPGIIESRSVIYRPDYNLYDRAPETVYDNTVLVNAFDDGGTVVENRGGMVSGRQVSLVTIGGDLSEARPGSMSLAVQPVSSPSRTVSVRGMGDSMTVTVPTVVAEEVWVHDILASEIDDTDDGSAGPEPGDTCADISGVATGNDRYVVGCTYSTNPNGPNELRLSFQELDGNGAPVVYDLRMSRVGIGTGFDEPRSHYMTDIAGDQTHVPRGGSQKLTVEVRDRFNTPVSGATVTVESVSTGSVSPVGEPVTDAAGRVAFAYQAPATPGTATVELAIDGGTQAHEAVEFTLFVGSSGGDAASPHFDGSPTITAAETETCDSFSQLEGGALICPGPFRTMNQLTVEYSVEDDDRSPAPSGISYVKMRVLDTGGQEITSESVQIPGDHVDPDTHDGVWISPWIDARTNPAEVEVTVVDEAGNTQRTTVPL